MTMKYVIGDQEAEQMIREHAAFFPGDQIRRKRLSPMIANTIFQAARELATLARSQIRKSIQEGTLASPTLFIITKKHPFFEPLASSLRSLARKSPNRSLSTDEFQTAPYQPTSAAKSAARTNRIEERDDQQAELMTHELATFFPSDQFR